MRVRAGVGVVVSCGRARDDPLTFHRGHRNGARTVTGDVVATNDSGYSNGARLHRHIKRYIRFARLRTSLSSQFLKAHMSDAQ